MVSPTDYDLVRAIAQGDTQALETLYTRYGVRLLAYLVGQLEDRLLAEEVLQDVMLAVWQGAGRFRGDSAVSTWLLAIARRRAISARQRHTPNHVPLGDMLRSSEANPLETVARQAEYHEIRAAMQTLPAEQRETLELIFYHGLSGPEAAKVLGVAPGTIKSRLHRAKTLLHRVLRLRKETSNAQ